MPLAEAVSASSLLFYWQAQYQGQCGQSFHDVKAVLVCQLRFDTCLQGSIRRTFPPSPSAGSICRTFSPSAAKIRQSADSAKVRQIWYQVCRFGESSADSAKVRQIRQKFGRFSKSSANPAKVRQIIPIYGFIAAELIAIRRTFRKVRLVKVLGQEPHPLYNAAKSSAVGPKVQNGAIKVRQMHQKFGR